MILIGRGLDLSQMICETEESAGTPEMVSGREKFLREKVEVLVGRKTESPTCAVLRVRETKPMCESQMRRREREVGRSFNDRTDGTRKAAAGGTCTASFR